jgi:hypothetical protein
MSCCGRNRGDPKARQARPGCVLCRIWQILRCGEKTPEGDPCVVIPGHIARKPDPCIYSQFLLMQLNQPVTWDNPDVRILLGGAEQYTYGLTAGTEYDVAITVHNSSRDKPALGTLVDIRWIEFGAGAQITHPIAVQSVDVPLWPGTATVTVKWRTPDTPGHYCIEVMLSHPDDGNPSNNRGWNNTQVHQANSPVVRTMRVFNRDPRECPPVVEGGGPYARPKRAFFGWGVLGAVGSLLLRHAVLHDMQPAIRALALMAAGYVVLTLLGLIYEATVAAIRRKERDRAGKDPRRDRVDCHLVQLAVDSYEFADATGKAFVPGTVFQGKAPSWNAQVVPSQFVFAPGEAFRDVELRLDAPDNPGLTANFNVNVWQGGVPSGGATFTVHSGGQ